MTEQHDGTSANEETDGRDRWPDTAISLWCGGSILLPLVVLRFIPGAEAWSVGWFAYALPVAVIVGGILWGRRARTLRQIWQVPAVLVVVAAVAALLYLGRISWTVAGFIVLETAVVAMIGVFVGTSLRRLRDL